MDQFISVNQGKNGRRNNKECSNDFIRTKNTIIHSKASIVEDWETSGLSCPEFCRRYDLIAGQLYKWPSDAKTGAIMSIKNERDLLFQGGIRNA